MSASDALYFSFGIAAGFLLVWMMIAARR